MQLRDVSKLIRPRQWTKNLAVFAAIIFSGSLTQPELLVTVLLAFMCLNMVSGGLYALNDAIDAERDREHPIKRDRPVAAGRISRGQATVIGVVLIATGLALAVALDLGFSAAVIGYVALQLFYGFGLKHIAIIDMLVIAAGFVLRAVAGALVIGVPVSPWLVLCTGLLALFLATAKRRHELILLDDNCSSHRPVLAEYSIDLLDSFMVTLSAATITTYALYTFFETLAPSYSMMLTIPFVIYGVLRYEMLVLLSARGGRPEEVLLGDKPILITVVLWAIAAVLALYALPTMM